MNKVDIKCLLYKMKKIPIFISLSGSHIYGFADDESDIDIRGCHIEPTNTILSLKVPKQTTEQTFMLDGKKYDIVTHELTKFLTLMHKPNGNIIEQVLSPTILYETKFYPKLKELAEKCISKKLYHHYRGFTLHMLHHIRNDAKKRHRKDIEYAFRTALTGIYVLETGKIEHNLYKLLDYYNINMNKIYPFGQVDSLITMLDEACQNSKLPENSNCYNEINEYLLMVRNIM